MHSLSCSLLTLSRVIVALGTPNQTHINFRDSKLTRILQPSLSGNARMAVICCATPSELYLEETRSTLQFASRAKLVKTRAQVNEVMDDRSVIRRLQRELAEARRNGGGGTGGGEQDQEHFLALEQKAANAGVVAQVAEDKLRRLQASILNSGGMLFGGRSADAADNDPSTQPRKRRLSDGDLGLGSATPMKGVTEATSPKTMPRANKRKKTDTAKSLAPSTEVGLLREALTAKKDMMRTWKKKASEISRLVEAKESELISVNCSNDILRSERDAAKEDVASSIAALHQEMEAMSAAHDAALHQKETVIEKSLAKLEQELKDRKILEETVDALQEDKAGTHRQLDHERETTARLVSENETLQVTVQTLGSENYSLLETTKNLETEKENISTEKEDLNVKFESLQAERDRGALELAQSNEEKENLVEKFEEDKERLQDLNGKIEVLESTMQETQEEKNQALEEVKSLGQQLDKSQQELQSRSAALEDAVNGTDKLNETVAGLNEQVDAISLELEEWEDKCQKEVTEKESIDANLTAAKETIEALEQDQSAKQDEISKLDEKAEGVATELEQAKADLGISKNTISNLEISLGELTEERDNTRASWESSKMYLEEAHQKINSLEASLQLSEINGAALTQTTEELSK
jgi:centromeric protein E